MSEVLPQISQLNSSKHSLNSPKTLNKKLIYFMSLTPKTQKNNKSKGYQTQIHTSTQHKSLIAQ